MENEIIKIKDRNGKRAVSARELHEKLENVKDFKDFFITVSKMRVEAEKKELHSLKNLIKTFTSKFGAEAIAYLTDSIDCEFVLPCKNFEQEKTNEKEIKDFIVNNFNSIFPDYKFVECEKEVYGIGRIDIYATYGKQDVIIELKVKNKNPNIQLIAYGSKFQNPILIGITEQELKHEQKIPGISYFALSELKRKMK